MKIRQRREGDVLLIELSGRMTFGEGDSEAGDAVRSALKAGESKIVVDMGDVPVVDSFGVGELASLYSSAAKRKAALKLVKVSPRVRDVLEISGLTGVFEIFDEETAAMDSFGPC